MVCRAGSDGEWRSGRPRRVLRVVSSGAAGSALAVGQKVTPRDDTVGRFGEAALAPVHKRATGNKAGHFVEMAFGEIGQMKIATAFHHKPAVGVMWVAGLAATGHRAVASVVVNPHKAALVVAVRHTREIEVAAAAVDHTVVVGPHKAVGHIPLPHMQAPPHNSVGQVEENHTQHHSRVVAVDYTNNSVRRPWQVWRTQQHQPLGPAHTPH